jgi:hypothetical protein
MRIALNAPRMRKPRVCAPLAALAVLAAVMASGAVSAPAAQAAGCTSLTHAYLTMPGRALVGYDNSDGVQRGIESQTASEIRFDHSTIV